jgi:hypothetical protein
MLVARRTGRAGDLRFAALYSWYMSGPGVSPPLVVIGLAHPR